MSPFPLTTSVWISVFDLDTGAFRDVGITEALVRSHRVRLADRPQESPVLLRLLAAAFDAAAGPATYEEWTAAWQAPALDAERITAYLDRWEHRLDLFHPDEPAFQSGALTEYHRDARVLDPSYLGGNSAAWFDHRLYAPPGQFPGWEPAAAARNLLILNGYDVAAIKRAAPGDPAAKGGKIYGAPVGHVAQLTHVHITGQTLKDTLLLNLPPLPRRAGDAPVWERPTPDAPMTSREPTGRLDVLTWPSRRMRLHLDPDGRVDAVAWHDGDRMADPWQNLALYDPMSMWRTAAKVSRWIPQRVADQHGMIIPWKVTQFVLDPAGDDIAWPVHCGTAEHLVRLLADGVLTGYGPISAIASCTKHTNKHRSVIADIPGEKVPLASGEYLTGREKRADLAAAARTASLYASRIRQIVQDIAPSHTPYADRITFMGLYGYWPRVADLLVADPLEGRKLWRSKLRQEARDQVQALPLRPKDKARLATAVQDALITSRFLSTADRAEWASETPKAGQPRTGRPTRLALTAFGETKSIAQWAKDERCVVSYPTLLRRSKELLEGAGAESILTTPGASGPRPAPPAPEPEPEVTARRCVNCGRPLAPDAARSRCEECQAKRSAADWAYKREIAEAVFNEATRATLLARLAAGEEIASVCLDLDLTPSRVYGYRAYNDQWRVLLDQALTEGRNPDLDHGTEQAYRHGRCRCPECRAAHAAFR